MTLALKKLPDTFVHKNNSTFCEQTTEDVISAVLSVLDGLWSKLICGLWNAWYLSKGPC